MPEIKIEATGDMQNVINDLFSEMKNENAKMKANLKDNKAGTEFIRKLEAVHDECMRIFQECKVMIPLHNATFQAKGQEFTDNWRICRTQFLPKNDLIKTQVNAGKLNIPALTDAIKSELSKTSSPEMMSLITKFHGEVLEARGMVQKLWSKVLVNHKKLNDHVKAALDLGNQANPDGAVHPAPVRPPLSSSYEAKNQNSLNQSQAANQRPLAPAAQRDQTAKK